MAGLGNELLTDDGVGIHACRLLAEKQPVIVPHELVIAEVGTAVMDALHLFEWADCILAVDSMRAGGPAGTIYLARPSDIERQAASLSLHGLSLIGALRMLAEESRAGEANAVDGDGDAAARPDHRCAVDILGVEPASLELGLELSGAVRGALPEVVARVAAWIEQQARAR